MKADNFALSSIGIIHPTITPDIQNYYLPSWPPPPDLPIVIDKDGQVISVMSDHIWDLSPWEGNALKLNFGDGPNKKDRGPLLTKANADSLRLICVWWLWGPKPSISSASLKKRFSLILPIFSVCSREGIYVGDLHKHPRVADQISSCFTSAAGESALLLLHDLFEHRENLKFVILDSEGLRRLAFSLPEHHTKQTPYIPPRIWTYQVNRLREVIDDYLKHESQIEECFKFCLGEYKKVENHYHGPFNMYYASDSFTGVAHKFGIYELICKWIIPDGETLGSSGRGISTLGSYLTLASKSSLNYILNFSLMRINEAWDLRSDCFSTEHDENFGSFHLLSGETTKTIKDDDARWITAPSTELAVRTMKSIAHLRMEATKIIKTVNLPQDIYDNPYLITRNFEPWSKRKITERENLRPLSGSYGQIIATYPKLFDPQQITITEDDLKLAKLITPTLNSKIFKVGVMWRFAWHQLRRTGAVNMQASGLVSDPSMQYQLKHGTRMQSLYYGQGHSRVRLNDTARTEYIKVMYQVIGKEVAHLLSDRYVSPYGQQHKNEILKLVDPKDEKKLTKAAASGQVSWRSTFFGGCSYRGYCPHGGIDNIVRCGGGDGQPPCAHALYDKNKKHQILQLQMEIEINLQSAEPGTPYHNSLQAQHQATENALNVITKG